MLRKSIYAAIVACFCLLLFVGAKASANRSNDPSPIDRLAEMIKAGKMETDDISYAEMFYLAGGATSEEAHEKAVEYYKEYDALYAKAIEAGFDVDDEEVKSYVESLKELSKTAANSEDVKKIINAYPSEDDYWKHMLEVYKKQLPVQKYVAWLDETGRKP